jgi:hypothetical protein
MYAATWNMYVTQLMYLKQFHRRTIAIGFDDTQPLPSAL